MEITAKEQTKMQVSDLSRYQQGYIGSIEPSVVASRPLEKLANVDDWPIKWGMHREATQSKGSFMQPTSHLPFSLQPQKLQPV